MFKKSLSLSLIGVLVLSPMSVELLLAKSETKKSSQSAESVKTMVKELGIGADVKVWRKEAGSVNGQLNSIDEEAFVLKLKDGKTEQIPYSTVQQLDPTRLSYHQVGQPNPAEVRRVLVGVGVDKEAKLTLANGTKLQCKLQAIGKDDFTFKDSKTGSVNTVAFGDVTAIESKMSKANKITIITLLSVGAFIGLALIFYAANGD